MAQSEVVDLISSDEEDVAAAWNEAQAAPGDPRRLGAAARYAAKGQRALGASLTPGRRLQRSNRSWISEARRTGPEDRERRARVAEARVSASALHMHAHWHAPPLPWPVPGPLHGRHARLGGTSGALCLLEHHQRLKLAAR